MQCSVVRCCMFGHAWQHESNKSRQQHRHQQHTAVDGLHRVEEQAEAESPGEEKGTSRMRQWDEEGTCIMLEGMKKMVGASGVKDAMARAKEKKHNVENDVGHECLGGVGMIICVCTFLLLFGAHVLCDGCCEVSIAESFLLECVNDFLDMIKVPRLQCDDRLRDADVAQ